jgi:hypothetical protein
MKQAAAKAGLLTFFAMVCVGIIAGRDPWDCTVRSCIGAVVAFAATWIALKLIVDVMVQVVIENTPEEPEGEDDEDELEPLNNSASSEPTP